MDGSPEGRGLERAREPTPAVERTPAQHTASRGSSGAPAPRGSTVPRRPSGALGQRGPLGPPPLRFGPPAAHGDERAGLRGRPLSVASCNQGSWKGATAARVGLLCYVQFSLVTGGVRASP